MMTATKCPTHDQLKALTLGQLSNEDSDALFQHITECDECRSELETVEDVGDSLIVSLRDPVEHKEYSAEPDCRLAVVKALGALALSETGQTKAEMESVPSAIGEYEIVRPIGSGGMGNVFLARHTKLGREVALKVLASHRMADSRMLERFEAEMRSVGRLSHPNIVTAHDAREVNGTAVLVTEFISGLDLGQLLQRTGPLNVADASEIARQVAVALVYTNSQGFVHRDIKPSNVMLSAEGGVKLLDLGLARIQYGENERTEITGTGQAMGTADYVAPEQVTDSKTVDIRADIYGLGCTLFKLLTGRAPFADDLHLTTFAKMTAHVSKKPPSLAMMLPSAPRSLVQLVDSMLAKRPVDRPQLPQDIVDALAPHCKDHDLRKLICNAQTTEPRKQAVAATKAMAKPKTQSWMRRTVPFSVAIGAGLLGVLVGVCLSIIIIITNPDGTKTILQLAEGSKVELREGNGNELNQPETINSMPGEGAGADAVGADSDITPLSFGVLVNRDSTGHAPVANEAQILEATRLLRASDGSKPVRTQIGTWYAVADQELGAQIKELNAGKYFVLVSDQHSIRWPSIHRHVLSLQTTSDQRETSIELVLDKLLGSQLAKLTKPNIRNQLAIIVNGQVRSAPVINSEVGERVRITGIFEPGEAKQLSQWLHGGLVDPVVDPLANVPVDPDTKSSPKPYLKAYKLNPAQVAPELGYRNLLAFLDGRSETRLSVDEQNRQLVLLANPAEHELATKSVELQNNLHLLGLTFHNFHDAHARFPGTSNTDNIGGQVSGEKKIHPYSWRVAILPYIEQNELFLQYRFNEPWNSKHNLTLLDKMPAIYRSPFAESDQEVGETNFLGFATEESALGIGGGETLNSFTDGISNTLLLIEAACTVPWTKPQDIPDAGNAVLFDDHPFTYLMADGTVKTNSDQPSGEVLREMISRTGNRDGAASGK